MKMISGQQVGNVVLDSSEILIIKMKHGSCLLNRARCDGNVSLCGYVD